MRPCHGGPAGASGRPIRRVRIEISLRGDGRRLREIVKVLEPEFRGDEDVDVRFLFDDSLRIVLEGDELSHVLATVGTLNRLLSVYEEVSGLAEDPAG